MSQPAIEEHRYGELLANKVAAIREMFADTISSDTNSSAPTVIASAPRHYRMRAEFRIWHDGDTLYYAMFAPADPKTPIRVDDFPVASHTICELMPRLREALERQPVLRRQLFQIEFLSTLSGDMLVTLIYHRKLDETWQKAANTLAENFSVQIIGRSRGQKIVLDRDYVLETLPVGDRQYHYRQYEGGFSQPNAEVNCEMIQWAMARAGQAQTRDLLELYCGNGNFTIPLAACFRQVLATEISKTSVRAAEENFALNHISNARIARMSSEDFTSALRGEREFRRLKDIDLGSYDLGTVLVDPPRAGLDPATCALIAGFDNIIYISCSPTTLHRDLQILRNSHQVCDFALFDQFPYTDHMECGVYLQRRSNAS